MSIEKYEAKKERAFFCPTVACIKGDWTASFLRNKFDEKLFACGRLAPANAKYIADHDDYPQFTTEEFSVVP